MHRVASCGTTFCSKFFDFTQFDNQFHYCVTILSSVIYWCTEESSLYRSLKLPSFTCSLHSVFMSLHCTVGYTIPRSRTSYSIFLSLWRKAIFGLAEYWVVYRLGLILLTLYVYVGNVLEVVIGGLEPEAQYQLQVAAYTRKGDGERSRPKKIRTKGAGNSNWCSLQQKENGLFTVILNVLGQNCEL